jgi:hypothetical protein
VRSGWYPDPTGRHETRWWDGVQWREWVDGRRNAETDPLPETAPLHWGSGPLPMPSSTTGRSGWRLGCLIVGLVALWVVGGLVTIVLAALQSLGSEWNCADSATSCNDHGHLAILIVGGVLLLLITALVIGAWLPTRRDEQPRGPA